MLSKTVSIEEANMFTPVVKDSGYAFLSDYLTVQSKINFVKNYPQWGLSPQPPDQCSTN